MSATIELTQGFVAQVDLCDSDLGSKLKWRVQKTKSGPYARAWTPMVQKKRKLVFLHRLIGERMFGESAVFGKIVDHANRDTLDCRRNNLRIATVSDNAFNKKMPVKASSRFRGVTKRKNGWEAICRGRHLGVFKTEEDAAIAYNNEAKIVGGNFAVLNEVAA